MSGDAGGRLKYLDVAKGIGILLVIIGHCIPDASTPSGISEPIFAAMFKVIYSFHMPLFFFISGFLTRPMNNRRELLKKRAQRLLVPYFFVGLTYLPFKMLLSNFANAPYDLGNLWKIFFGVNPDGELWFLYAMFLAAAVMIFFGNRVNFLGLSVAAFLAVIDLQTNLFPVTFFRFGFFFVLGIYMRSEFPAFMEKISVTSIIIAAVIFAAGNFYLNLFTNFLTALMGILIVLWVSQKLSEGNFLGEKLALLGIFSMDLYILSDVVKIPFRIIFWNYLGMYTAAFIICVVCAVGISFLLSKYFIRRNEILRTLVLGLK